MTVACFWPGPIRALQDRLPHSLLYISALKKLLVYQFNGSDLKKDVGNCQRLRRQFSSPFYMLLAQSLCPDARSL